MLPPPLTTDHVTVLAQLLPDSFTDARQRVVVPSGIDDGQLPILTPLTVHEAGGPPTVRVTVTGAGS